MNATTAPQILNRAAEHMNARAAARDLPEGERSMARAVGAFNFLTGHTLSVRDGWLFMATLKAARACTTPTGLPDDYEDGAAYFALAGEAAAMERAGVAHVPAPAPANDNAPAPAPEPAADVAADQPIHIKASANLTLRVPPGLSWIAQDRSGTWYAYQREPQASGDDGSWINGGAFELLHRTNATNLGWQHTKRRVR